MSTEYVFIVGLPRTGTKLMNNVIRANPGVPCRIVPETWFLGDLFRSGLRKKIIALGDMKVDANVGRLADLMYSGKVRGTYWRLLGGPHLAVPRETMERLLLACDRSDRAIYEVIMRAPVVAGSGEAAAERAVVGDKMPGNLFFVPTLLEWFEKAKIVHTFRDPRAILASEWRRLMDTRGSGRLHGLPRPLYSLAIVMYITVAWLYAVHLHKRYTRQFPGRYRMFRYEDLVGDPETTAREICDFLGLTFHEGMLEPNQFGSSFTGKGGKGFDRAGLDRWRAHLAPWMRRWMTLIAGSRLKRFGYER